MKKLLASTAVLVAFAGAASAQSVLERVLSEIDNSTNLASVNGTFANIAENIGGSSTVYYNASTNDTLTEAEFAALQDSPLRSDYTVVAADAYYVNQVTGEFLTAADYNALSTADQNGFVSANGYALDGLGNFITNAQYTALPADSAARTTLVNAYEPVTVSGLQGINGSINNEIDGITAVTQQATSGVVTAIEYNMPTFDFGDMATTVLGAVNTGTITLGVNSAVDEASTSTTNAISAVVDQLGGSADTGAIVLNIASNMTGVNGSINNVMEEVNGSVGNLATTVLGAVNTGTITSGVDAAVAGIVGSTSGGSAGGN